MIYTTCSQNEPHLGEMSLLRKIKVGPEGRVVNGPSVSNPDFRPRPASRPLV